jgi:hypothetical protein
MTAQELKELGISEDELNDLVKEMKARLESGRLKIIAGDMPVDWKRQMTAIRFRRSTGKTIAASVSPEIARVIQRTVLAARHVEAQVDRLPLAGGSPHPANKL